MKKQKTTSHETLHLVKLLEFHQRKSYQNTHTIIK